ncbi:hypothetical protein AURDEDRAFT_107811 [Auricularia subglabra TFB-10046 SS5]|nr:hypothetical protein AURDEDRAFT_107811 [Auricularia subglabra TFB-10046 SS5]
MSADATSSTAVPVETPTTQFGHVEDEPVDLTGQIAEATRCKERGNAFFKAQDWEAAAGEYLSGLACLPPRPKRKGKGKGKGKEPEHADLETSAPKDEAPSPAAAEEAEAAEDEEQLPAENPECRALRGILYANVAACRMKQGDDKATVELCTQALLDDPKYTKVLQRRAAANERIASWTALDAANADYTTLLTLFPDGSPDARNVQRLQRELAPRIEAARKREMDEMMSKFKGLGNSILGKFGLSTDNFQFTPNGAGGYSLNFVNEPK